MASLNKCCFIGNLTSDPEIRMAGESKVASFSIACNEKYKGKDGNLVESCEFINIVFWNRQAEICEQYLKKGSSVYIEGKQSTRSWDDKGSGEKRYRTEIRGLVMQMLGGKSDVANSAPSSTPSDNSFSAPPAPEDGLPF